MSVGARTLSPWLDKCPFANCTADAPVALCKLTCSVETLFRAGSPHFGRWSSPLNDGCRTIPWLVWPNRVRCVLTARPRPSKRPRYSNQSRYLAGFVSGIAAHSNAVATAEAATRIRKPSQWPSASKRKPIAVVLHPFKRVVMSEGPSTDDHRARGLRREQQYLEAAKRPMT
jgi:hypothetical protein